jgi:hypothetical protein
MKKFLLSLALLAPMIHADSADTEILIIQASQCEQLDAGTRQFLAKFNTLRSFCQDEYNAIGILFDECRTLYASTADLLLQMRELASDDLKPAVQELIEHNFPVGLELIYTINELKETTQEMEYFNSLIVEKVNYQEMITTLISVAQKLHTIRVKLETVKEYVLQVQAAALTLTQNQDS